MKKRTFIFLGYTIELYDFGYAQYLYPSFNTNAEFVCNNKGFKQLSHYLRTVSFLNKIDKENYELERQYDELGDLNS